MTAAVCVLGRSCSSNRTTAFCVLQTLLEHHLAVADVTGSFVASTVL